MEPLKQRLQQLQQAACDEVMQAGDLGQIEQARLKYLGKKGLVTIELKQLGKVKPEDRPAFGEQVNIVKAAIVDAGRGLAVAEV